MLVFQFPSLYLFCNICRLIGHIWNVTQVQQVCIINLTNLWDPDEPRKYCTRNNGFSYFSLETELNEGRLRSSELSFETYNSEVLHFAPNMVSLQLEILRLCATSQSFIKTLFFCPKQNLKVDITSSSEAKPIPAKALCHVWEKLKV